MPIEQVKLTSINRADSSWGISPTWIWCICYFCPLGRPRELQQLRIHKGIERRQHCYLTSQVSHVPVTMTNDCSLPAETKNWLYDMLGVGIYWGSKEEHELVPSSEFWCTHWQFQLSAYTNSGMQIHLQSRIHHLSNPFWYTSNLFGNWSLCLVARTLFFFFLYSNSKLIFMPWN